MSFEIRRAESDNEIQNCFRIMSQLRPHLDAEKFVSVVRGQMQEGYRLAYIMDKTDVAAVAGYRMSRSLSWGKYLYVDDLVTDEARRSLGFGKALLQWLVEEAKQHHCHELHLDSGMQRKDAHRFYEREGMDKVAYHFIMGL